jgi:hypothetical protein
MGKIMIWAAASQAESKGLLSHDPGAVLEELDAAQLNKSLKQLAADLDEMLDGVQTKRGFKLNGLEVGLEVTADAGVNLIGTMTVGGKASITLKFEKA